MEHNKVYIEMYECGGIACTTFLHERTNVIRTMRDNSFVTHYLYVASDYGALLLIITLSEKRHIIHFVFSWYVKHIS